jgi:hypothetical protein
VNSNVEYTHDWVKGELSDPKFRSKIVKLKTDYKREQKSMAKLKYETSKEFEEQSNEDL